MVSLSLGTLSTVHWLGIALALVSAGVHLVLGVGFLPHPMGILFILAGTGFAGAVVLLLIDYRRRLLYLVGIPYTGVQIVLWIALNLERISAGEIPPSHLGDKVAQVGLILVLVYLYRTSS
ncbi:DUF7475 family protein [Natronorarus salvus]|uniref:DUF7475 family protein n=1 Tax=Natronorarus salvus TaxID=3117733 RepID=UPI002F26B713